MRRRRGSATALNASVVVAARAMRPSYAHKGMRQGHGSRVPHGASPAVNVGSGDGIRAAGAGPAAGPLTAWDRLVVATDGPPAGTALAPRRVPLARHRALVGLLGAVAVSDLGSKLTFLALPWLVLVTTRSPAAMGVVSAAELLPFVVSSAVSAPLIDRFGYRAVAIATDLGSAAVVALIVTTHTAGMAWLVMLVALLGTLTGTGHNAGVVALRPAAETAGADLLRVTSVYYGIARLNDLVFVPLGGVLIAGLGTSTAMLADAVSFAASAALVAGCVPGARPTLHAPGRGYFAAIGDGLAFLRRDRLLPRMLAVYCVTNLCHQANISIFVPLWIHDVLHSATALGVLTGGYALGGLLGSAAYTVVAGKVSRYRVFLVGFLLAGAPRYLAIAFGHQLAVGVVAFALSGLAVSPILTLSGVVMYQRVPEAMQARVFGVATAVSMAGMPLGVLLGGWAAGALGLRAAALIVGAAYLAAALAPTVGRDTWRQLDGA
jgi:MFS family permease